MDTFNYFASLIITGITQMGGKVNRIEYVCLRKVSFFNSIASQLSNLVKTMFKPIKVHSGVILVLSLYNVHVIYKKY